MPAIVGYLTKYPNLYEGEPGAGYNYIFAKNGVFIHSQNKFLSACIPTCECMIRGLEPEVPSVIMINGKIPQALFDLAFNTSLVKKEKETYFAITWDGKYRLFMTEQAGIPGHVRYTTMENTVMDIHSHGHLPAYFSGGDNRDEQGFRLSCLIGDLNKAPRVSLRIGVYGSFYTLKWTDVFDGSLNGVIDNAEEVLGENELSLESGLPEDYSGWHWWDRLFGCRRTL